MDYFREVPTFGLERFRLIRSRSFPYLLTVNLNSIQDLLVSR